MHMFTYNIQSSCCNAGSDIPRRSELIGADHSLFGSDYPHGEGLADPVSFVDDLPGFSKDEVQLILLALILAFNHDFLDLEGRGQVEKIQLKYVILLQTHLRTKYPTTVAASKLTKAVMLPAVTREIVQITKKRLDI